jgi:hypothetical protein
MAAPTFNVLLNHLSPDAKSVGVNYAHEQLQGVSLEQLRALLHALSVVASRLTIYEPAIPEIRIKTERSSFVVRTRHRQLCLMGWESKLRGEEHTVGLIIGTVTGVIQEVNPAATGAVAERRGSNSSIPGSGERGGSAPSNGAGGQAPFNGTTSNAPFGSGSRAPFGAGRKPEPAGGLPRWAKITGLGVLIVALNAFTVWQIFLQPAESPVQPSQPIPDFETTALLAKAAGEYETGGAEGDRRLIIETSGNIRVAKYGPERAILQETTRTAKGGVVGGRTMLITSDPATIEIKDADSVIYFKTTYKRRSR